jgi:hypothetical protein
MKFLIRAVVLLCLASMGHGLGAKELRFEPAVVRLSGVITLQNHFGPPNWGEDPKNDEKVTIAVLRLDAPIDVIGDPASDINTETVRSIRRVQLVSDIGFIRSGLVGRHVTIEGRLYTKHTAHHYTKVLCSVDRVVNAEAIKSPAK